MLKNKIISTDEIYDRLDKMAKGEIPTTIVMSIDQDGIISIDKSKYNQQAAQKSRDSLFDKNGDCRIDVHWDFVYAIQVQNGENGPVKIGIATDPEGRLSQLQVANPYPLKLLGARKFESAQRMEKHYHKRYGIHRLEGEWFELPENELKILLGELKSNDYPQE